MGRQRNVAQMKEQEKSPEKEPNKMEANKLPEFKTMVIRVLRDLERISTA